MHQGQHEFDEAAKVMLWNKWLLRALGLWPSERSELRFSINFGYFVYHMILEYLDLCLFIGNLEHVIMNLTENMAFSQILIRMAMLRRYNFRLGIVIDEALTDFNADSYKSDEERQAFIKYNIRSKLFVKLLVAFVVLTASSYYVKPLMGGPPEDMSELPKENESSTYLLPYRFHVFYEIEDTRAYVLTYVSQFPFVFVSGFGQCAADCLMVTLVFHLCGQMSVLAIRLGELNSNVNSCKDEFRSIVRQHERLLHMGQTIQEAFSETLLAHLIGATSLVCILGFQLLTNFANGQTSDLAAFVVFAFLVLLVLYAHCTVGESLLEESMNVCDAFYNCDWPNMTPKEARIIVICMARSQRPMCLTAGKFGIFCLSTITSVLKTALSYLSVLRTFL